MAVLKVTDEELPDLVTKANDVFQKYVDLLGMPSGLTTTYKGIGFGDWGTIWVEMSLGEEAVMVFREIIEEQLGHLLTDLRFHSHMTIFRNCDLTDEKKSALKAVVKEMKLGSATIADFTLRVRKVGKDVEPAIVQLQFADASNN